MKILTESDKVRAKIPLNNDQLKIYLKNTGTPFDVDGAGVPWLGYELLLSIQKYFEEIRQVA